MKDVANVITVSSDGTAKLWEVRSTECLLTFRLVERTVCGEERKRGRFHMMSRDRSSLLDS